MFIIKRKRSNSFSFHVINIYSVLWTEKICKKQWLTCSPLWAPQPVQIIDPLYQHSTTMWYINYSNYSNYSNCSFKYCTSPTCLTISWIPNLVLSSVWSIFRLIILCQTQRQHSFICITRSWVVPTLRNHMFRFGIWRKDLIYGCKLVM